MINILAIYIGGLSIVYGLYFGGRLYRRIVRDAQSLSDVNWIGVIPLLSLVTIPLVAFGVMAIYGLIKRKNLIRWLINVISIFVIVTFIILIVIEKNDYLIHVLVLFHSLILLFALNNKVARNEFERNY